MAKNKKKQQGGSVESYMGGLTDKGFNYNGAWGGTMQMGGNLPGAVGFTYARTGSIPSNGKYAKKTKASAEEGMEILPDPTDPDRKYKLSATIASAKDILNPLLRAKDPAKYDAWTKGRVAALREKGMPAMREYMEQNPISIYLSPQEVKTALSKQREGFYEDYIGAIRGLRDYESEIGTPMRETLYGGKEGQGELENLNYGWRFATLPVNLSKQATTTSGKPIPEDSFTYSYDPIKDEYKKTPYYKNGGKMMSYYQAGLDFEPKTISEDGSELLPIANYETYNIQKGDTLSNIASKYNIPISTLANVNQLENPNLIKTGEKINLPKNPKKEFKFEEIPTSDKKKVVIDNFSKHYDYIVEGDNLYYKVKGGKTWADISENKKAQKNLLDFINKNEYWAGYGSGEKEAYQKLTAPPVPQKPKGKPIDLLPISNKAVADATLLNKEFTNVSSKKKTDALEESSNFLKDNLSAIAKVTSAVTKQKAKSVKRDFDKTIDDVKESVTSGFNTGVESVQDFFTTVENGVKRKYATHTGEDDDAKVPTTKTTNKPRSVSEYYQNQNGFNLSAVIETPDKTGRQYKQQTLPLSAVKLAPRNRGEYKDITTDGLEVTTFHPFTKDKMPDNTTVLAIDPNGNLKTGTYGDLKNDKNLLFSKTFRNNIVDFSEKDGKLDYVSGKKSGNPKYNQPKVKVMDDNGNVKDGSLNILVKDDSKKDYYGSIQGGRILFVNPETKEQYLVSGSVSHIKNEFKRLKGNAKYLEAYTLDNGTYSRGLSYKDKKLTPDRLKSYDLENTSGGNGLYILDYNKSVNKYAEEFVENMPNVRSEKDESYKKGHPLKNELKNVVLHHTAYTNPATNERQVREQFMKPGQNSSHVVIEEDGKRTIYASPEQVTFHAGESMWNNRSNVNDFSVGVEFQGDTNRKPLTNAQIESFIEYYTPIAKNHNISIKDIITHQMIAGGRKPDISKKDYDRILKTLKDRGFKKNGGDVKKDNAGYWNPENWGEPVEIDSNEITMEGVYEPLLGISDTGDVQMMYPGEDYEFDGESVTEYPVAQDGVGIPRDIYLKQAYKESRFNPKAISPLGKDTGSGLAQISQGTYNDFLKATKYKPEQIDLMNPEHSAAVQRWAMNNLYNAEFINKPNQSNEVRLAKTLAAYNYGRGNLSDALNAAKEKGMDIYNSLDWMKSLPKETSDYVNKILLKKDDTFEKEYSEAVKKSPYTKYYKTGGNINQLDEAPLQKLDDLLNFSNNNDMKKAKKGKNIPKAQVGNVMDPGSLTNAMTKVTQNAANLQNSSIRPANYPLIDPQQLSASQQMSAPQYKGFNAGMLGGSPLAKTIQNVKRFTDALEERKKAKVFKNVSEIVKEAATSKPDMPKRKYVRPEDNLLSPDQSSFQSFGTGYDILGMAREGMQIGGNLTEIQNMYNPGTLYDGLGYEPLEDSQMKQYKKGGRLPHAQTGMEMQAAMQVMDLGLGIQGALAEAIPGIQTKKWTEEGMQNMQQGAYNQSLANQFGAFMKDGGWVSNDWQPQVITKFGDYTMDQLLSPPNDAEMLRAGGNVRNMRANYMGDDERLSIMAMGGNLQTHWGGKGEVMSYNPYSAGSGETVMLRGQSHEETDGRGNSGIGMSYGGNMVEAERGEPVAEMEEGGAVGDTSAVVFGNMKTPSYVLSELTHPKFKDGKKFEGMKFKNVAKEYAKQEIKDTKNIEKGIELANSVEGDSPYDRLKLSSAEAMIIGGDMGFMYVAADKKALAGGQNAILDTAEEMGLESDALARGKFMQAKKGAKIPKGQTGVLLPKDEFDFMSRGYETPSMFDAPPSFVSNQGLQNNIPSSELRQGAPTYAWDTFTQPFNIAPRMRTMDEKGNIVETGNIRDPYTMFTPVQQGTPTVDEPIVKLDKKMLRKLTKDNSESSKIKDFFSQNEGYIGMGYNELLPYIRPTNKLPIDPSQFMGEQLALATNTLEPVQAQTFKPMLETRAPKMSAQEALNKNQADFNALARQIGNNPAALSMLAAQKQAADRQTIAQVEATNIQQEMAANNRNIAMLNEATIGNLKILDEQFVRQAKAKANTKTQAQVALNSIASKIGQNKLENFQSGVMQNMYNYRFGPQGRIINYNPLAQFNTQQLAGSLTDEMKQALAEQSPELAKQLGVKVKEKEKSRNGSIVKAIKNL